MIIDEMKYYWPLPKRTEYIEKMLKTDGESITESMEFQGSVKSFKIYKVPIEMPIYRLNNGRTLASQQEYIVKNNKSDDFFTHDPESIEALFAQEEILRDMVDDEGLLEYFRTHDQVQPLVLTHEGYVVNGNRRLCAYRMLLSEDPVQYKKFKHAKVIFLPVCDESDIDILEAELQIIVDIKAKYGWVDTAMILRNRKRSHGWSDKDLARIHEMSDRDVIERIGMLDLADQYLDYKGRKKEYSLVSYKEYAFKQLYKYRGKCKDAATKDAFTQLGYKIIDNPNPGDRKYRKMQEAYENLDEILKKAKEELVDKDTNNAKQKSVIDQKDNLTSNVSTCNYNPLVTSSNQNNIADIVDALSKPENKLATLNIIDDTLEKVKQQKMDYKNTNYCLDQISDAHTFLRTALSNLDHNSNLKGAEKHLDNIETITKQIRAWMQKNAKN